MASALLTMCSTYMWQPVRVSASQLVMHKRDVQRGMALLRSYPYAALQREQIKL